MDRHDFYTTRSTALWNEHLFTFEAVYFCSLTQSCLELDYCTKRYLCSYSLPYHINSDSSNCFLDKLVRIFATET